MNRYRRVALVVLFTLFLVPGGTFAQANSPMSAAGAASWPATDAGRLAAEWVKAVNSKDLATYTEFLKQHISAKLLRGRSPDEMAKAHMRLNEEIAPVELANITESEKYEVTALLRTHTGDTVQLSFAVDPEHPEQATSLRLQPGNSAGNAGPRGRVPDTPIGKDTARAMCTTAALAISTAYVDRAKAPGYAAELRKRCDSGAFDSLTKRDFQRQFTEALREITNDRHMYLMYNAEDESKPVADAAAVKETMERLKKDYGHGAQPFTPAAAKPEDSKWGGHGLEDVKMLDGNIGYIKVSMFPDLEEGAGPAAAAMKEVAGAKALIFDLRNMRGGSQELVNLFCSYLFADAHKHLLTLKVPALHTSDDQFTFAKINGSRMPDVPVYILTNERTFSAGEAFTYILQQFRRATVVGETTGGGGNINEFFPLGQGFALSVSIGTATHPLTKQGWEHVGVVPDVKVAPADALDRARALAQEKSATAKQAGK
jgi:Peptidase family S41